ncbi:MAG: hypothetical protein SFX73_13235 [Kofleriaceae bacterium]|nr:hypothetical protein [Kofleriaceae bacterium]
MSKLTALITTLVLGTSSIAAADTIAFNASARFRPAPAAAPVRDHRIETTPVPGMYRAPWVALSQPVMLDNDGRNAIRLATPSRFSQLRLQSTAGRSFVDSIIVRFADGSRQEIKVNRALDARSPMVHLDISHRAAVERVVIKGSTHRRASVQLFGTRARPPVFHR